MENLSRDLAYTLTASSEEEKGKSGILSIALSYIQWWDFDSWTLGRIQSPLHYDFSQVNSNPKW